jgi:hypothetical protein
MKIPFPPIKKSFFLSLKRYFFVEKTLAHANKNFKPIYPPIKNIKNLG